jgi:transposase
MLPPGPVHSTREQALTATDTITSDHTVDAVVGVDTHRDTHTAALTDPVGRQLDTLVVTADAAGYRQLMAWADQHTPGPRLLWAIEGARSHGAGLGRALRAAEAVIVEVDRPTRRARRHGKSDAMDALHAARSALAAERVHDPRADGAREAARLLLVERDRAVRHRTAVLNQLRDLVLTADDTLRARLRGRSIANLLDACQSLRQRSGDDLETRIRIQSLQRLARRARALTADVRVIEDDLRLLVEEHVPELLAESGVGTVTAAQIWISWSHPGRIRSEAAFAALAGASPLEASSGQRTRHRLNRGGDRHLNRALHHITLTRLATDPVTRDYVNRRVAQGKTPREARRCLKRYLARRLWRVLEHHQAPTPIT